MYIQQGDIFLVDVSQVGGDDNKRPVVIVQNNIGNKFSPTVIVASITYQISKSKLPTHVKLSKNRYPLQKDCVILLEQLRTIDKARLIEKLCTLEKKDLDKVKDAWLVAGGIKELNSGTVSEVESYYKYKKDTIFEQLEDNEYEFKYSENPVRMIKDTIARYICSFLNAKGGRILYGITNEERIIKGLKLSSKDIDDIKLGIYDKARGVNPGISPDQLEIVIHNLYNSFNQEIDDEYIVEVMVPAKKNKDIHYISNGKELVIRVDGSSRSIQGNEIVSFVKKFYGID